MVEGYLDPPVICQEDKLPSKPATDSSHAEELVAGSLFIVQLTRSEGLEHDN